MYWIQKNQNETAIETEFTPYAADELEEDGPRTAASA
jgi:hypothetical protein